MSLIHVVSMSKNKVIGINNRLPWNIPADLVHFKNTTTKQFVVMGVNTFKSIIKASKTEEVLPDRFLIVLTTKVDYMSFKYPKFSNVLYMTSDQFLALSTFNKNIDYYIVGGAQVYNTIPGDKLIVTHVDIEVEGDTTYDVDLTQYKVSKIVKPNPSNGYTYNITYYTK